MVELYMDYRIRQAFQPYLLKGEEIRWSGQPDRGIIFSPVDIFLVPFSLIWGGMAIFAAVTTVLAFYRLGGSGISLAATLLFFIPFTLVGLYMIFGRFIYKDWSKKRTFYA